MMRLMIVALCVVVLAGCSKVYKQYEGELLSADEMAIFEHANPAKSFYSVNKVDGKWRGVGLFERYEFSPGEHSITFTVTSPAYSSLPITLYFNARAGQTYYAKETVIANRWGIDILNKKTGETVSYQK